MDPKLYGPKGQVKCTYWLIQALSRRFHLVHFLSDLIIQKEGVLTVYRSQFLVIFFCCLIVLLQTALNNTIYNLFLWIRSLAMVWLNFLLTVLLKQTWLKSRYQLGIQFSSGAEDSLPGSLIIGRISLTCCCKTGVPVFPLPIGQGLCSVSTGYLEW